MSLVIRHLHVEIKDANQTWQKVSEYDQEIPQSHNADHPTTTLRRDTEH